MEPNKTENALTEIERDQNGRFTKQPPSPGRAGARDRLNKAFIKELTADFEANGASAIVECRKSFPAAYVKIIASLLPKHIVAKRPEEEMSDDELESAIRRLLLKDITDSVQAGPVGPIIDLERAIEEEEPE